MEIGKQIKARRAEFNLTQDELAKKLNVGRTTVANWEQGRNYPDIQTIVELSNILDISLDALLRPESAIVKEITRDTKIRKKQTRKIIILSAIIAMLVFFGLFGAYKNYEYQDISLPNQINSIHRIDNKLNIKTNLPFYRSLSSSLIESGEKKNIIKIVLTSKLDFTMKNKELLTVNLNDFKNEIDINRVNEVHFICNDTVVKAMKIEP